VFSSVEVYGSKCCVSKRREWLIFSVALSLFLQQRKDLIFKILNHFRNSKCNPTATKDTAMHKHDTRKRQVVASTVNATAYRPSPRPIVIDCLSRLTDIHCFLIMNVNGLDSNGVSQKVMNTLEAWRQTLQEDTSQTKRFMLTIGMGVDQRDTEYIVQCLQALLQQEHISKRMILAFRQ
jgi:hypothetical protein